MKILDKQTINDFQLNANINTQAGIDVSVYSAIKKETGKNYLIVPSDEECWFFENLQATVLTKQPTYTGDANKLIAYAKQILSKNDTNN